MYENENTETADSNHKYDELAEDLHKYWNKVVSHLGREYQALGQVSKQADLLEIMQALHLVEEVRQNESSHTELSGLQRQLQETKESFSLQQHETLQKLNTLEQLAERQRQVEKQNQDLLKQILRKGEENSIKIAELQKDFSREINQQSQLHQFALMSQALPTARSALLKSELNSPKQRELRQQSMYNSAIPKTNLTKVPGMHNLKISSRNNTPFKLTNL